MDIAFIGMGTMGVPMAINLLKAGHRVVVHNRTRDREQVVAEAGATRAASPKAAAMNAELIITCVSDGPDVEAMMIGPEGVIHGAKPGAIAIDMSTISAKITRRIAETLKEKGISMLDAPISGGSEGAKNGTLSIMVGGEASDVAKSMPAFEAMGKTITHVGAIGSGQLTKAINQIIIAGTYWGVAEGMAMGLKAGLDMEKVVQAVGGGAAGSWGLTHRSGNMLKNEYPLGFRTRFHRKDLNIALEAARELGVPLPIAAYVEQIETGLMARGYGDEDLSNMARVVREQAGLDDRSAP